MQKNKEPYGYIYVITNEVNGKKYVGQTKRTFEKRYIGMGTGIERVYNYMESSKRRGMNYNEHLFKSVEKYGFDAFTVITNFYTAYSKEELNDKEIEFIEQFDSVKNGYNIQKGGFNSYIPDETRSELRKKRIRENNSFYGKRHTLETREYLSKIKTGKNTGAENPNYGNFWSIEKRLELSKKKTGVPSPNKGRKMSEEDRLKNSLAHKGLQAGEKHPRWGKTWDDDHKRNMSDKMKGRYSGTKNPNSKRIICITTNEVFDLVSDAAKKYGISPTGISACLTGKRKRAGKTTDGIPLEWKYIV